LLGCGLAARSGARNTAEIAVMAARERLDAVRALGLDPWRVLLLPRLIATAIVAALVYFPACALVMIVAFVLAQLVGDQSMAVSFWSVVEYFEMPAIANGLVRLTLFGVVVGASSCLAGVAVENTDRSAGAVGRAVYAGSVGSLAGVMTINAALSILGGAE
jgi:phospholipid/cholesterol/gamma-HCH transport system permease protein